MLRLALTTLLLAMPVMAAAPTATAPAPPRPRWGDANAANLAAMARPADLAAPAAASPALGAMEAAAMARLLAGEPRDLRREGAESGATISPASGAGGAGEVPR